MAKKKHQSKRQTLHQMHKVKKKVKEHLRKQRRLARKTGTTKRVKKDPGIPNMHPFKEQMLQQFAIRKAREQEERDRLAKKRAEAASTRRAKRLAADSGAPMMESEPKTGLDAMRERADRQQREFAQRQKLLSRAGNASLSGNRDASRHAYYGEFKKMVEAADVILEVLDARDPIGCRTPQVEAAIMAADSRKRIVLVLNKVDLVPRDNVERWLRYLRAHLPTVAFKCSTQEQSRRLGQAKGSVESADEKQIQRSECLGADALIQLLKNYARSEGMKRSIAVGVIGYPNVGKSSLINSLKRSRAVQVGASAGVTKVMQEVHLDKNIKLLDCPGIVFAEDESERNLVLRNCVKLETVVDAVGAVDAILERCSKENLLQTYALPDFANCTEFLQLIAKRRGKLKPGGIADIEASARLVIGDWMSGRIGSYTEPPSVHDDNRLVESRVVEQWGRDFQVDNVQALETEVLERLPARARTDQLVETSGAMNADMVIFADVDEEDDAAAHDSGAVSAAAARFFVEGDEVEDAPYDFAVDYNSDEDMKDDDDDDDDDDDGAEEEDYEDDDDDDDDEMEDVDIDGI